LLEFLVDLQKDIYYLCGSMHHLPQRRWLEKSRTPTDVNNIC
jgi:hypothetical protein